MRGTAIEWLAAAALLSGCAGPTGLQLRADTEEMGTAFGFLLQGQILQNVVRMIDDPWVMPGHVEVSTGTLQVQDQASVGLKLPYTGLMGHGGREADPNLQTQEQHSFIIAPVTDGDDLRRLHAIYRFAICSDPKLFRAEWGAIIRPYAVAIKNANKTAQSTDPKWAANKAALDAERAYDAAYNAAKPQIDRLQTQINELGGRKKLGTLSPDDEKALEQAQAQLNNVQAPITSLQQIRDQRRKDLQGYSDQTGINLFTTSKTKDNSGSQSSDQSGGGGQSDTIEVEIAKGHMIEKILGGPRWLYWRAVDGTVAHSCPVGPTEASATLTSTDGLFDLGVYGRYHLWTSNPEQMSQFMMLAGGAIPNTAGVHNLQSLASGLTGNNSAPKASSVTFLKTF